MQARLWSLVKAHKLAAAILAAALALIIWQFVGGIVAGVKSAAVDRRASGLERQAQMEVAASRQASAEAQTADVARQVEDQTRARVITPQVEATRQALNIARDRSRKAEKIYAQSIDPALVISGDDALLFARNCADYARLYPGHVRAGCH